MPSKNTMNGFAVFMYEIKERRRLNMSGQQLATFCSPLWANLSAGEKKQYDMRAKEMKAQKKATDGDMARRDNVGNIIGTRKNPEEERRKRRQTDQELVTRDWPGKDLMDEKFYFVNFQDMCELSEPDNNTDREWLPREVAIVEYTMRRGIIRIYHAFIDPGPIPKGFRFTCMQKSDAEHKIPIEDFELASNNYPLIWRKMKELLRDGMKDGQYPPVFCLDADYEKIKYLMDWMWCRSDDGDLSDNPAGHVCALEDLVVNLLAYSNQPNTETISNASVVSRLDGSHWDYISNTSCEWHEDQETKYCALGIVRRYAFTISDILSQVYPINLTERHVPIRSSTEEVARVLPPESMPTVSNQQRMRGKTRAKEKPGSAGDMRRKNQRHQAGKQTDESEGSEEFTSQDVTQLSSNQTPQDEAPVGMFFGPRMGRPWGHREAPLGPASGQFDDWPELGSQGDDPVPGGILPESRRQEEDAVSQMSALSLSATSSAWLRGSMGRGTTTDISSISGASEATSVSAVPPPPGLSSSTFGPVPDQVPRVGRGRPPQQDPNSGLARVPSVGRGSLQVGRGAPPSANRDTRDTQPVGAQTQNLPTMASMGWIPPAGRGTTPISQPAVRVGRGQVPVGQGALAAGQDAVSVGRGAASVGRGAPPVGRGAPPPSVGRSSNPGAVWGFPGRDVNLVNVPTSAHPTDSVSVGGEYRLEDSDEYYEPPSHGATGVQGGHGVAPSAIGSVPMQMGRSLGQAEGRGMPGIGFSAGRGYTPR